MQRTVEGKRRFMLQEEYGFEKKEIDMRKFVCRSSLFLLEIDRKLEIKVFATKKIIEIIEISPYSKLNLEKIRQKYNKSIPVS